MIIVTLVLGLASSILMLIKSDSMYTQIERLEQSMYDTPDLILQKMDDDEFIPACVVPGADETLEKWLIVVSAQGDTGSEALSEWNDAVNTWTIPCLVVCLLGFVEYGIWYIFVCKHS